MAVDILTDALLQGDRKAQARIAELEAIYVLKRAECEAAEAKLAKSADALKHYQNQFCESDAEFGPPSCGLLSEQDCQGCKAAVALAEIE